MNDQSPAEIPLFQLSRIEEICNRFEQALRDGQGPLIEDYLDDIQGAARRELLRRLIFLDLEHQDTKEQHGVRSAYDARFPQDSAAVTDAFEKSSSRAASHIPEPDSVTRTAAPAMRSTDAADAGQTLIGEGTSPHAPVFPRELSLYEVQGVIGQGGFGAVFKAHDRMLNRDVAVKVPKPEIMSRPQVAEAFLAEARVLARLEHPGIVPCYDCGRTDDGRCYLVSKFIEGRSLAEIIPEVAGTPRRFELVPAIASVAEALHYAHKHGLVHCDIKPANILITGDGGPVIVDFGLAVLEEEQRSLPQVTAGTPYYMSPEQVRGERHRLDGRTDIWALGAVLYECLTNRRPFGGETVAQILDEILHREPKPLRMIDEAIPAPLEAIILRCLAKDVTVRYSAAGDVARDLRSRSRSARAVPSMSPERRADLDRFLAETATRKAPSSDFGFSLREMITDSPRAIAAIVFGAILFGTIVFGAFRHWTGALAPDGDRKFRNWPRRAAPIHRPPDELLPIAGNNPRSTGQRADLNFDVSIPQPAYKHQVLSEVLFDEAHNNFHTASGRYKPFADLVTNDGYHITPGKEPFTAERLAPYNLLITANAPAKSGPSRSAFTESECDSMVNWVRAGGSLLLITDHEPWASGSEELGKRFGVDMSLRKTEDPANQTENGLLFSREKNQLGNHPILRGRNDSERVDRVLTFVGQSLKGPPGSVELLKCADTAEDVGRGERRSAAGRAQGIAFQYGQGRVVVMGEAGALSAQVHGDPPTPMGMNVPECDNRKLALNIVHWLSGLTN